MDGGADLGWTPELGKANLGDRASAAGTIAIGNATNRFSGLTTGSAGAGIGMWSGTLYVVDPEETGGAAAWSGGRGSRTRSPVVAGCPSLASGQCGRDARGPRRAVLPGLPRHPAQNVRSG